jgi:hypothetical protein
MGLPNFEFWKVHSMFIEFLYQNMKNWATHRIELARLQYCHAVTSISRALGFEPGTTRTALVTFVVIDHETLYGHSHCTSALACTEVIISLLKWRQLVLVNCLTACQGTMQWLNCAPGNSMWLTAMVWSENYQHHYHTAVWPGSMRNVLMLGHFCQTAWLY